jgi:hypothetical protein
VRSSAAERAGEGDKRFEMCSKLFDFSGPVAPTGSTQREQVVTSTSCGHVPHAPLLFPRNRPPRWPPSPFQTHRVEGIHAFAAAREAAGRCLHGALGLLGWGCVAGSWGFRGRVFAAFGCRGTSFAHHAEPPRPPTPSPENPCPKDETSSVTSSVTPSGGDGVALAASVWLTWFVWW